MADLTMPANVQELQMLYDARFRKWVAFMAIGGFFAYSCYASWRPPTLPGDATGQIISAWQSMACVCVGYYMSMLGPGPTKQPAGVSVVTPPDTTATTTTTTKTEPKL